MREILSKNFTALTPDMLRNDLDRFRDIASYGSALFTAVDGKSFLELRIGAWQGPEATIRAGKSTYPIISGLCSVSMAGEFVTIPNLEHEAVCDHNGKRWLEYVFEKRDQVIKGVMVDNYRFKLFPVDASRNDDCLTDEGTGSQPLGISRITADTHMIDGSYGKTFLPPLPVFVED